MTTFLVLAGWFVLSVVLGLLLGACMADRRPPIIIAAGRLLVADATDRRQSRQRFSYKAGSRAASICGR